MWLRAQVSLTPKFNFKHHVLCDQHLASSITDIRSIRDSSHSCPYNSAYIFSTNSLLYKLPSSARFNSVHKS
uniref:Uncharacterized protein n=1 Tax=Megaselia scalaris TaxID=36166 RepID=T1GC98_MEGSC